MPAIRTILYFLGILIISGVISALLYWIFKISQFFVGIAIIIFGIVLAYFIQDNPSNEWYIDIILGGALFTVICIPFTIIFGLIETYESNIKNSETIEKLSNEIDILKKKVNSSD